LAHVRKGSTFFGASEVRCWRWLFGNQIPVSLLDLEGALLDKSVVRQRVASAVAAYSGSPTRLARAHFCAKVDILYRKPRMST